MSVKEIFTLVLVGISVGLGNFAASVAIGLEGVSKSLRIRIAVIFGLFETGMPIVGLIIGHRLASTLGGHANVIGGSLLGLTGLYLIYSSFRKTDEKDINIATKNFGKLLVAGLALSIDNLIVGFSLGTHKEPLLLSALIIGATSVGLSLLGLELGNKIGNKIGDYSETLSGIILLIIGILITIKIL